MEQFRPLGEGIEEQWRQHNYDERLFPSLVAEALRNASLPSIVPAWDVLEWALKEPELPRQRDLKATFGDPPITVYSSSRFHIDIYFWFEGTTAIHQHGFCGAFQVLLGSSIHSWYEFECKREINAFMQLGEMSLKTCELLEVGAVQEILPGRQYIHSLFHLDHPSATIVVRTDRSPLNLPQFAYHTPGLAVDPFFEEPNTIKKMQVVSALYKAGRDDADQQVADLLGRCDLHTAYLVLSHVRSFLKGDQIGRAFGQNSSSGRFQMLCGQVAWRDEEAARALAAVFEWHDVLDDILDRRAYLTDADQRFFLALLLNVEGRHNILALIKQRFPEVDPVEKVLDWIFDLSEIRLMGAADKASALGIPDFGDVEMDLLERMLRGESPDPHTDQAALGKVRDSRVLRPLIG